jgi:hypothetical protein
MGPFLAHSYRADLLIFSAEIGAKLTNQCSRPHEFWEGERTEIGCGVHHGYWMARGCGAALLSGG